VARKALTLRYRETPRGGSSALRNDPTRFFIRLCNFYPVDRALAVKIEERLPVQSAPPVPIEGRRASAALRDRLRAARRVLVGGGGHGPIMHRGADKKTGLTAPQRSIPTPHRTKRTLE
jgi:hypothetical protein